MLQGARNSVGWTFFRRYSTKRFKSAAASSVFPKEQADDNLESGNYLVRSPYDVQLSDLNLGDFIWRNISRFSDDPAMTCGLTGRSYKYKELRGASLNFSVSLLNVLGLKPGDVVGLVMPNMPEFPIVFLGAASAGLVVTPANPLYTAEELSRQFSDAKVRAVMTVAPLLEKVRATIELIPGGAGPIIVAGAPTSDDVLDMQVLILRQVCRADKQPEPSEPDALVALPFSSGTTGVPKGVMLTHRNMVASLNQMDHPQIITSGPEENCHFGVCSLQHLNRNNPAGGPKDRCLSILPFFHIYGLQGTLNMCLSRGYHVMTLPKFEAQSFSTAFNKFKPTMMGLVPPLVQFLAKSPTISSDDLAFLRLVICGAAPLAKAHLHEFLKKVNDPDFIFKEAYALTETACMATMMPNDFLPNKIGSCGLPGPLIEMKVVDEQGHALPIGETGELLMRGPNVMKGYLNNEKATREILSEDGWLMTGDLAYFDSDGFVYLVDRMKELIKVKGLQVSPTELEDILVKIDGVADVAVIGVPDEISGELPKAFVVKKPDSQITEEQICAFLEPRVAPFKQLKGGVQFIDEIPKNVAGKVLKKELKKL